MRELERLIKDWRTTAERFRREARGETHSHHRCAASARRLDECAEEAEQLITAVSYELEILRSDYAKLLAESKRISGELVSARKVVEASKWLYYGGAIVRDEAETRLVDALAEYDRVTGGE